jgi:hypothetical protein
VYEVLDFQSTLEIMDSRGMVGKFQKSEKVRFLQNNVIALQDQVWGVNKYIYGYKSSPGIPVDFYQSGNKTLVLISLRDVKSKGDETGLRMEWYLKGDPIGKIGTWETYINQFTHRMNLSIVFPAERTPKKVWIIESNKKKSREIEGDCYSKLPSGEWKITWEKNNPQMYETYSVNWEW